MIIVVIISNLQSIRLIKFCKLKAYNSRKQLKQFLESFAFIDFASTIYSCSTLNNFINNYKYVCFVSNKKLDLVLKQGS